MGYMYIDDMKVEFENEKNILEVTRRIGIELPTLCYYSELSTYGACRMCMVENEKGGFEAACSTLPRDGMRIKTNTPALIKHRRMILELLLAAHCRDCTTCDKSGACRLQELALRYGVKRVRFADHREEKPLDTSSKSIVRDPNKCILCGDCVRVCREKQGMGILDFAYRGSKMRVMPAFDRKLAETDCVNCGQCAAVCPTGAITVKDETDEMWKYLNDPKKMVVVQVAPAVRVALGEQFGLPEGANVMGKIVKALKMMGVDKVFDTVVSADMTVVEEAGEFLERVAAGGPFPMFTSCCPAWIKYAETKHPEFINKNISSCKSPLQMFGAVIDELYGNDPERELISVAVMPCTAKKYEVSRSEFTKADGKRIVELSLTTQELANMIKNAGIDFANLEEEFLDAPFDMGGSGAGVIFGVTGGVAEAVIRECAKDKTNAYVKEMRDVGVRGKESMKEAVINVDGRDIHIAVVHGLKAAEDLIQKMERGEAYYDIVEVMACPEGCIGGAGQPFALNPRRDKRAKALYRTDNDMSMKFSSKHPETIYAFDEIVKGRNHEMLHVHYNKNEK
ncbi:MAG: ferredoxin [Eubacteriales Family XIII. Incertae Sedis bacterium]|nr:MAG: ferredoxin [Clostridiales Family XIII bacterium]